MIIWEDKKIKFKNGCEIKYKYNIQNVLEFKNSIIVHTAPSNETEYESFRTEFGKEFNKGPVFAYSKVGEKLWQWKTAHVNYIEKVKLQTGIILDIKTKKELDKFFLLISCTNFNFYIDPDNGQITKQEQTK
ncbi:MAG: hypothetical protein GF364_07965 [Candidatus Lokiarchaeota archaeon]|nr:hypothetical protein [Candidatus Lokiarchaeota archaeon]